MNDQYWSWILTVFGLVGFVLAGKKVWWCWYVNIANQFIWLAYSLVTEQYGFLIGTGAYMYVFGRNAVLWTKEHYKKKRQRQHLVDAFKEHVNSGTIYVDNTAYDIMMSNAPVNPQEMANKLKKIMDEGS